MQEKYGRFEPLGICQKLFIVVNSLISHGLKRVTLGHEARQCSPTVPPDDGSAGSPIAGQEILVHFKQTEEGLEHWTPVNLTGSPVDETWKYGPSRDNDQLKLKKRDVLVKGPLPDGMVNGIGNGNINPAGAPEKADPTTPAGEGSQAAAPRSPAPPQRNTTALARGKAPNKSLGMQDVSEEEKVRMKGKSVALFSEKSALPAGPDQGPTAKYTYPMHHISVAPNINEKSDAFIRRKRQAMGLNGFLTKKP